MKYSDNAASKASIIINAMYLYAEDFFSGSSINSSIYSSTGSWTCKFSSSSSSFGTSNSEIQNHPLFYK